MLVEDDNNLREIYEARLLAEGYEIVSAHDGEEALALAVKEKPDLIIADVMMPKISGFDMLDILRSTPESKDTKVIMMTALSQAEDKARADKLGADRYLVKSQVTLEDVAKIAREVLDESGASATASTPAPDTTSDASVATTTPTPAPQDVPVDTPTVDVTMQPVATPPTDNTVVDMPASSPVSTDSTGPTTMTFDPSAVPGPTAVPADQPAVVTPSEPAVAPEPVQMPSETAVPTANPAPVSIPVTVVEEPVATPPAMPNEAPAPVPVTPAPEPESTQSQPAPQVVTPTQAPASPGPDPNLISL